MITMPENLFMLYYEDTDVSTIFIFEGPEDMTQMEFEILCDKWMPTAAKKAVLFAEDCEHVPYVDWHDIMFELCEILESHGFTSLEMKTAHYKGASKIGTGPVLDGTEVANLKDAFKVVWAHNLTVLGKIN